MRERTVSVASNLLYAVLGIMGTIALEAAKGQECQQRIARNGGACSE